MKFITITKNELGFDEDFETASFDTKDEAVKQAEEITSALYENVYTLNHGEFARPEYQGAKIQRWLGNKSSLALSRRNLPRSERRPLLLCTSVF